MPASSPLIAKADEMTRLAGTPSIRAMVKFVAAARIAMPRTVRRISQPKSASSTALVAMVMTLRIEVWVPAIATVSPKMSGSGTMRGRGEMKRSAAFCSRVEKAKEVISTAVTDFARPGGTRRSRSEGRSATAISTAKCRHDQPRQRRAADAGTCA